MESSRTVEGRHGRLPTGEDVIDLERSSAGVGFGEHGLDRRFLTRMRQCGYLDALDCRTTGLERLRFQYQQDGLVLFLGAGVSKASGIPEWRGLIDSMLKALAWPVPNPGSGKVSSLSRILEEEASMSMLSQFDLVAHEHEKRNSSIPFASVLRKHLYGDPKFTAMRRLLNDIPEGSEKKETHNWEPILSVLRENTTLTAIGDLLLEDLGGGASPNSKIHAVITTNVDNLLQVYVMGRANGRRLLTTVDRPSVADHPGRISVYYLHGWLDFRDRRRSPLLAPPLVFRESEYFTTIANSNAFANYTAQSLFQRCNVLFVGTSMEDLNVRRWLYNSFEERRHHRAEFLRARYGEYPGAEVEAYAASIRHSWFKRDKDLPEPREVIKDSLKDSMRHLGVEVIWYQEHSQVAEHLRWLTGIA